MRTRWMMFGLVIGAALALGIGSAVASGPTLPKGGAAVTAPGDGDTTAGWWAAMEAMHDSPWMQRMHSQMPADLQGRCDALHDQMGQLAQQHPDFGPGGMMGGSTGTGSGYGGMMVSGSGMMGG